MVDQFVGTWKMSLSENFDEYMRAIGVGMASRQVGNVIKPKFIVSVAEGVISMKTQSTFKSTEIKFKLDEEFEERTADDRVTKTIVSFINGKLVQKQTWDGRSTTLERALESDWQPMEKHDLEDP
uniref:Cellular retinoic acid-binding protein 1 n=1 Tax=Gadus morhua TaxID=8049 RepID=A0A8C4Z4F7_GADMO